MAKWILEPGHSAAGFRSRHMMVSWVRGHFKDAHGEIAFDVDNPQAVTVKMELDAGKLWTGEAQRDKHLRSADFFDVENHPTITFVSIGSERTGAHDYRLTGDLTMRGVTKGVSIFLRYLGSWSTPYWTEAGNAGNVTRIGFVGKTVINRHEFGVSWNSQLDNGGVVVGDEIFIKFDLEGLLETEFKALEAGG